MLAEQSRERGMYQPISDLSINFLFQNLFGISNSEHLPRQSPTSAAGPTVFLSGEVVHHHFVSRIGREVIGRACWAAFSISAVNRLTGFHSGQYCGR